MKKLIILLLLLPSLLFASSLPEEAFKNAESYLYVREATGKNDGPEIKQWLGYVWNKEGSPYCAAMIVWCFHTATQKAGKKDSFPRSARSATLLSLAKKDPVKYKVISPNQVIFGAIALKKGDVAIFQAGVAKGDDFNGHTEIVETPLSNAFFASIGGNTASSMTGDQREGQGVYRKKRKINASGFPVRGFIRVN